MNSDQMGKELDQLKMMALSPQTRIILQKVALFDKKNFAY